MKNNIKTKLLLTGKLLLVFILSQGCQKCHLNCTALPDINIYHYGLLDSMPAGTRVVFQSNTGKLDTATYGPIINKKNRFMISGQNTQDDCDNQSIVVNYQEQEIAFSNKFGMSNLLIYRGTKADTAKKGSLYWYGQNIDGNYRELSGGYNNNLTYNNYTDVTRCIFWKSNTYDSVGCFLISDNYGLLRINYKISSIDSVLIFKTKL